MSSTNAARICCDATPGHINALRSRDIMPDDFLQAYFEARRCECEGSKLMADLSLGNIHVV